MKTCVLAVVLMLVGGAIGAAPATGPAKPINGARGIAAMIPASLLPESGRRWTELQQRAANEWAENTLVGLPVHASPKVTSVGINGDVVGVGAEEGKFSLRDRQFLGYVSLEFTDAKAPGLSKMREGDRLAVSGVIKKVKLSMSRLYGAPETTVVIGIVIDEPKLEKNK